MSQVMSGLRYLVGNCFGGQYCGYCYYRGFDIVMLFLS